MSEKNIGIVKEVKGPVVDIEFPGGQLPAIYNAIRVTNKLISDKQENETAAKDYFEQRVKEAKRAAIEENKKKALEMKKKIEREKLCLKRLAHTTILNIVMILKRLL